MQPLNLSQFIDILEKENELIRIKEFVDPNLEITEIVDRFSKQQGGGKALLFENTGTDFPILINFLGSEKRIQLALRIHDFEEISKNINDIFHSIITPKSGLFQKLKFLPQLGRMASWMPRIVKKKAVCQEIIINDPDIQKFPVLTCWPYDGGKFITLPLVHTIDPVTGIRNLGMYRMQIFDKNTTGMHWHKHKTGARHYQEYKKLKQKMPVAVALGGDPVYTYSATAPLPDNFDEYILAGFLRQKQVELVKCITQNIYVPIDADIILEGYVDPEEELALEGPFGDHTGFYSLPDYYPKFHITCITHRRDAIFPAAIVGIPPQEDAYIAKVTERLFLPVITLSILPELQDMDLPSAGVSHNLTVIKINKTYPGQGLKVINALWGAGQMMLNKILLVVDGDVNIHNYTELAKHISKNLSRVNELHFSRGPLDVLDHSADHLAFGSKLGIDATVKFSEEETHPSYHFPLVNNLNKPEIQHKYTEIVKINDSLLEDSISVILFSIRKTKKNHVRELAAELIEKYDFTGIKCLIFLDDYVNIENIYLAIWMITNNIEPLRDIDMLQNKKSPHFYHIIVDGTFKTKQYDSFLREWPNIIVMTDNIIQEVDKKWDSLNIGARIESPSLQFNNLKFNKSAFWNQ